MSFKDSKAQILANSASDDSDISTMEADLATTAVVDDGYVLCTDTFLVKKPESKKEETEKVDAEVVDDKAAE